MSRVRLEPVFGKEQRRSWSLTDQEYIADFCIVAKRSLSEAEHRLFRFHFLLGADWKLCCRQLNIDRGNFFHEVYRIQQKLGKVFRELEPYALFPLDEYFGGSIRKALPGVRRSGVITMPETAPRNRLLPPVRKAA
jgi:hypothetical protein